MKIGVFDSGIGGLSVLKSLIDSSFFSEIIYYGDTARVPYGGKSEATIKRFGLEALEFFSNFDIDMLIVACNTVSAFGLNAMQKNAKYPVVGVIESGVLSLAKKLENKAKNILIIATKATIKSGLYEQKLHELGYFNTTSIQTGLFVPLVEEGIFSGELLDCAFRYYFSDIKPPDAIILGCTHFPLIQHQISAFFNNQAILIHSGEAIVEFLAQQYHCKKSYAKEPKIRYFASSEVKELKQIAKQWLKF